MFDYIFLSIFVVSLGVGTQLSCGFELAPSFIPHPSLYALVVVCAFNEEFPPRERERERERSEASAV